MRTNFSWLPGMATVACAAVVSVVATVWLLGLDPIGTESSVLEAGADSRPAVFRAEALPRPHRTVPRRKPTVAHQPRAAAARVRAQLPYVQSATEAVHASPTTQAIWPQVVGSAPVLAPAPVHPPAPALPTPVAPPSVPAAPAVPTRPVPESTAPNPAPAAPEAQLAAVATVQTGLKKTTRRDDKSVVPTKTPGSQPSPTPGPVRPTPQDGDHGDGGSPKPKRDSSEQQAKGDRHDKHSGD